MAQDGNSSVDNATDSGWQPTPHTESFKMMVIGAIGVVYGDLGTSPLYTMKEAFSGAFAMPVNEINVLGMISLITWTLIMVVAVKYVSFIMRADNRGEGGIMAMMALAQSAAHHSPRLRRVVVMAALLGAALFLGDGVITPSITVLSAMEGLEVAAPHFEPFVVPLAVIILIGVFWGQKYGTDKVGKIFGPVMALWFITMAVIGVWNIIQHPAVLRAINPWYAIEFFTHHSWGGFIILGAVVLCVTGAEALYTDMGHFGRAPIRFGWFIFVMPSLLLSYYGQAAHLMVFPESASNPFFHSVPEWALYPMIGLSTLAAVIASQAVISGAFSMTRQAIQLGFLPRMKIVHTSAKTIGQIYLPWVSRILMVAVVLTVVGFGSSNSLAGAYGIAVTGTMAIDSILFMVVASLLWRWGRWKVILIGLVFLSIDLVFFAANTLKIPDGGWLPLALGAGLFIMLLTWRQGRKRIAKVLQHDGLLLDDFVENIAAFPPTRVEGTAIFLTTNVDTVSHALLHNLKHNKVLHERNIMLSVDVLESSYATEAERINVIDKGHGFYGVELRYGFAEAINVPETLVKCTEHGLALDMQESTFFLSRETVLSDEHRGGFSAWRYKLFAFMARNAQPATASFKIPGNRLVVLGTDMYY